MQAYFPTSWAIIPIVSFYWGGSIMLRNGFCVSPSPYVSHADGFILYFCISKLNLERLCQYFCKFAANEHSHDKDGTQN